MSESNRPADFCTIWIKRTGDDWAAVCAIDGRNYSDPNAVETLSNEAFDELQRRHIPAKFQTETVSATQPPSPLASWEEYRKQLSPEDGRCE